MAQKIFRHMSLAIYALECALQILSSHEIYVLFMWVHFQESGFNIQIIYKDFGILEYIYKYLGIFDEGRVCSFRIFLS